MKQTIEERFFLKSKVTENGCWEWQAAMGGSNNTYGVLRINKKHWYAHRLSYTLNIGDIPKGLKVCHTCDNPKCVNPDHLFLGTQYDNIQDCIKKNRKVVIKNPNRSLSEEQAIKIKQYISKNYPEKSVIKIANTFNVSYIVVYNIVKGVHYKNP